MSTPAPFIPERVKVLTRPTLKFVENKPQYVRIESEIYIGKEIKSSRGRPAAEGAPKREPAHVANVVDLTTGEPAQIIISAVVLSTLNDEYPSHTYVGRCFLIEKLAKREGKEYFGYKVEEIKDPAKSAVEKKAADEKAAAAAESAKGKK